MPESWTGETWDHIVISPHLDDAALSCGGLLAAWTARGESVLAVTLLTHGLPPDRLPPHLRRLHAAWGDADGDPYAARRAEDAAALGALGVAHRHLGGLGALYRQDRAGHSLYRGLGYFGPPVRADLRLLAHFHHVLAELRRAHPAATIYAPLGIGGHVDHCLTHQAARRIGGPVAFYEDMPYALLGNLTPLVMHPLARLTRHAPGLSAFSGGTIHPLLARLQTRPGPLAGPGLTLRAQRPPDGLRWQSTFEIIDLGAKLAAALAYRSQLGMLFGTEADARQALTHYAARVTPESGTYAERLWHLVPA